MSLLWSGVIALVVGGLAFWLADRATNWSIGVARRRGILAHANERSSHTVPTPRVGGIGLMAGVAVGWLFAGLLGGMALLDWVTLGGVGLVAFYLGWADDRHDPPAKMKLLVQISLGLLLMAGGMATGGLVLWAAVVAWMVLVINAVNFMDGINGLAGRFAVCVGAFLCLGTLGAEGGLALLAAGLVGGALGFLRHNFPTARTFMGDCGSQPLGALLGAVAVLMVRDAAPGAGVYTALGMVMMLSVFLFDVVYTLVRRARRGEKLMQAHREHLYQRHLRCTGENHARTLRFVQMHLVATGAAGMILMRWHPAGWMGAMVLTAFVVATLLQYRRHVLDCEAMA